MVDVHQFFYQCVILTSKADPVFGPQPSMHQPRFSLQCILSVPSSTAITFVEMAPDELTHLS